MAGEETTMAGVPIRDLQDEVATLRAELAEARSVIDQMERINRRTTAVGAWLQRDEALAQRDAARAELDAMRPVVEAAKAWRAIQDRPGIVGDAGIEADLIVAVDVLYGAQPCICRPSHRDDDPICQYRPSAAGSAAGIAPREALRDAATRVVQLVTHGADGLVVGDAIGELRRVLDGGGQ